MVPQPQSPPVLRLEYPRSNSLTLSRVSRLGSSCSHAPSNWTLLETVSVQVTNTKGSTTTNTNDAHTTAQDTMTCNGTANVVVDVSLQTCEAAGSVNFPVTLGGWVWFYYGSKKNGHYECMQAVLVCVVQRKLLKTFGVTRGCQSRCERCQPYRPPSGDSVPYC